MYKGPSVVTLRNICSTLTSPVKRYHPIPLCKRLYTKKDIEEKECQPRFVLV